MTQFNTIASPTAEWVQINTFDKRFELQSAEGVLGQLAFRSNLGTLAQAETDAGSWSYKRVGFLNPRVTVRKSDAGHDLAIYQPKLWGDGTLVFNDGTEYSWKSTNFWNSAWAFYDRSGLATVSFDPGIERQGLRDAFKMQLTVRIGPSSSRSDLVPILLTLGFYLLVMRQNDNAAVVACIPAMAG
jgi:hypothetical protein